MPEVRARACRRGLIAFEVQILREIGRGQHGQVRLGQDVTVLDKLEKSRTDLNLTSAGSHHTADITGHARTLSWTESVSPSTGLDSGLGLGNISSAAANGYWAIKIMDRQPRKKLPGIRKSTGLLPNGPSDAKQIIATNEK